MLQLYGDAVANTSRRKATRGHWERINSVCVHDMTHEAVIKLENTAPLTTINVAPTAYYNFTMLFRPNLLNYSNKSIYVIHCWDKKKVYNNFIHSLSTIDEHKKKIMYPFSSCLFRPLTFSAEVNARNKGSSSTVLLDCSRLCYGLT